MAAAPIPAPSGGDQGNSPGPGGSFASPAPAINDSRASNALQSTMVIVSNARRLSEDYPQVTPEVREILNLMQRVMAKIKGGQQPAETQAPPV